MKNAKIKMGFWDKVFRVTKKALEKSLWTYSAYEIGNSDNDSEKISDALVKYQQQTNSKHIIDTQDKSETLLIIVLSSIILTLILLLVFCFKIYSQRSVRADRQIRLNTINSTANGENNNNIGNSSA